MTLTPPRKTATACRAIDPHRSFQIYVSYSSNKGHKWTPARPTALPNPDAKIHMIRSWEGSLLLAYNAHAKFKKEHNKGARTNLQLAKSMDEGKSWSTVVQLETAMDAGLRFHYPTIMQSGECEVLVVYSKFYHEAFDAKSHWEKHKHGGDAPVLGIFMRRVDLGSLHGV